MSRTLTASLVLAGSLMGLAASTQAAKAATVVANVDISFGARVPIDDDNRVYVSINSRAYGREPYFVDLWSSRFSNPDDLQVFLFLSRNSSVTPQYIYNLRRGGMSWFRISQRIHVPLEAFFVRIDGPAYPPFDTIYVRYDKYHRNPHYKFTLNDRDIRNLVVVRTMSDYYSIRPQEAMRLRASGRDARYLMVQEYRHRHEHEYRADRGHGHDKDRDDDHGRGHGHDKDHDHDRDDHDRNDRDR